MINRRIFVAKITVSNIISNGWTINELYWKNVFCNGGLDVSSEYIEIFNGCKNDNSQMKNYDNFLIVAYWGGSNEYQLSMV